MEDREARLNEVARIAVALEAQTGCPAQLLIAQWAIESNWGAKPVGHANYFGVSASGAILSAFITSSAVRPFCKSPAIAFRRASTASSISRSW